MKKLVSFRFEYQKTLWYKKALTCLLLAGILFLFIRSGWQTAALNPSMAYFSTKPLLNHAAVNTEWNLMSDLIHSKNEQENPYLYMDSLAAQTRIKPYINLSANTVDILTTKRPNIVLIVLESFTADLVQSLGGEKGIAPNMEKLIKEGILFNNIYAAG